MAWLNVLKITPVFRKERQARVKKHGHLNLTDEELAKIKAGKAEKLQRMANQREIQNWCYEPKAMEKWWPALQVNRMAIGIHKTQAEYCEL